MIRPFHRPLCLAAVIALALTVQSTQAEKLRWKFESGQSLNYGMTQKMDMAMSVMGMDINMKMTQEFDMTWKIKSVSSDGTAEMAQTITRVKFKMTGLPFGGPVEYDSKDGGDGGANPVAKAMAGVFGKLIGKEITLKMTARGEPKDVKLPAGFLDAIKGAGGGLGGAGLSEDTFKQMAQTGVVFPAESISAGHKWNSNQSTSMPFGTIEVKNALQYLGSTGGVAKISVKPTIEMKPKAGSPIKIDFKSGSGGGTLSFNVAKGRVQSSSMKQKLKMSIVAGGQTIDQNIDTTVELKLK